MRYMGSKRRIAKEILPLILKDRKSGQWYVEPFVGGCNMIDKVNGKRLGADNNEYLIDMWKALQKGWQPPDYISEKQYRQAKELDTLMYDTHELAFIAVGCSFGGTWFNSYARTVAQHKPNADILNRTTKSFCAESKRGILKQVPLIKDVVFVHNSYDKLIVPANSLIYCDPPYANTNKGIKNVYKHGAFDTDAFWRWCVNMKRLGHVVYVSEYVCPAWVNARCVWRKKLINQTNNVGDYKYNTEKLFKI